MAIRAKTRVRVRSATPSTSFLEKWKQRAKDRMGRLEESLAKPVPDAGKVKSRREWLDRMTKLVQSRQAWLEARLEHSNALQQVLRRAKERLEQEPKEGGSAPPAEPSAGAMKKRERGPSQT
jgi:hypothetical protein